MVRVAAPRSTSRRCEFALANRIVTLGGAGACCWPSPACGASCLGLEFLPKLEEGNFWIRATMPTVDLAATRATATSTACAG